MLKNKWNILWIIIVLLILGWLLKGCVFPSPEVKKVNDKFNQLNIAIQEKNNIIKNDMAQYVNDVKCFGNGACSYMIILDFKQTPQNLEEIIKKYTKEYAQMKYEIFEKSDKASVTMRLLAKTNEQTSLLCEVKGLNMDDFNVRCSNVNPKEYDK